MTTRSSARSTKIDPHIQKIAAAAARQALREFARSDAPAKAAAATARTVKDTAAATAQVAQDSAAAVAKVVQETAAAAALNMTETATTAAKAVLHEFVTGPGFERIIDTAAASSIRATLEQLGVDTLHPEETRKDMVHLRTWRELMELIRDQGIGATVKYVAAAVIAAFGVGAMVLFSGRTQ